MMNGDMLLHEGLWATAEIDAARTGRDRMDFRPLLRDMKSVISGADLAVCHMETPLAPAGGPFLGYPVFSAPPAIVPALKWAGYDACTTASNHSIDQGFDGLLRTLDDFDAAGVAHAGTVATRKESMQPLVLDVAGVDVALISATYGTNGIPLPIDQPWSVPLINVPRIDRMAARARTQGAEVVIVALHWGLEYMHGPTTDQLKVADQLTRSPDIDFIYGHHAHVVQPYDTVNGKWVAFGLGNAVAQQSTSVEGVYDGNTCRVTFRERADATFRVQKLEYIPTMITPFDGTHPMRLLNVAKDLHDPAFGDLHDALQATQDRVSTVIDMRGAFAKGVTEGK
ncbi:MAG: CapA family protein [Propionibacteriales bacterium]|nr:CapA family protein [Propionibacteriales bacterium]